MIVLCPLCGSSETVELSRLLTDELLLLWEKCSDIVLDEELKGYDTLEFRKCPTCDVRFFNPLISGSNDFYGKLQEKLSYFADDKYEFARAAALISESDSVLEIGAGKGVFPTRLATKTYTGLEFSSQAVNMARERGVDLRRESVEEHAASNAGRYDVVCSFQVLEHVSNPRSFLESATSCLKPGGRLMISVPGNDGFLDSAVNASMNLPPHHVSRWSDECLRRLQPRLGLTLDLLLIEPLADEHASWYLQTLLVRLLWPQSALVRMDPIFWMIFQVFGAVALKLGPRFPPNMRPRGHTVLAVYRKT